MQLQRHGAGDLPPLPMELLQELFGRSKGALQGNSFGREHLPTDR